MPTKAESVSWLADLPELLMVRNSCDSKSVILQKKETTTHLHQLDGNVTVFSGLSHEEYVLTPPPILGQNGQMKEKWNQF